MQVQVTSTLISPKFVAGSTITPESGVQVPQIEFSNELGLKFVCIILHGITESFGMPLPTGCTSFVGGLRFNAANHPNTSLVFECIAIDITGVRTTKFIELNIGPVTTQTSTTPV